MHNPNEYDDDAWGQASMQLITAVEAAWDAGASIENIQDDVATGFENATGVQPVVSVIA